MAIRPVEWFKKQLEKRHQIGFDPVAGQHEIEHGGMKLRVAKTDKGVLVLFPHAKRVEHQDFIDMMNQANQTEAVYHKYFEDRQYSNPDRPLKKTRLVDTFIGDPSIYPSTKEYRQMEFPGHMLRTKYGDDGIFVPGRYAFRFSGPFEVKSANRKGPLRVFRRVKKPGSKIKSGLEEAFRLLEARKQGIKTEVPVAVFIGNKTSKFPEMLFTSYISADDSIDRFASDFVGTKSLPPSPRIHLEDAMITGKARTGRVYVDAEGSTPLPVKESVNSLRRKIRALK